MNEIQGLRGFFSFCPMPNICFAFLTFEKKFYVASAHECAQGTWVFLLVWKIFSQTKFFPHGLQGLQIRLPTGSAGAVRDCGSQRLLTWFQLQAGRVSWNHMTFGLKGQAEDCLSHAVLTCESKQWANVPLQGTTVIHWICQRTEEKVSL